MACAVQNSRDKAKLGAKNAPWYAVWKDIDGKQHFLKVGSKKDALEIAREKERNAKRRSSGIIDDMTWSDFRRRYEADEFPRMRSELSREAAAQALNHFENVVNPKLILGID